VVLLEFSSGQRETTPHRELSPFDHMLIPSSNEHITQQCFCCAAVARVVSVASANGRGVRVVLIRVIISQ